MEAKATQTANSKQQHNKANSNKATTTANH
jgi:hypothetical protein